MHEVCSVSVDKTSLAESIQQVNSNLKGSLWSKCQNIFVTSPPSDQIVRPSVVVHGGTALMSVVLQIATVCHVDGLSFAVLSVKPSHLQHIASWQYIFEAEQDSKVVSSENPLIA